MVRAVVMPAPGAPLELREFERPRGGVLLETLASEVCGTDVHLWHGRQEWGTHVSAIRAVADHRQGWEVLAVPGCTALLGYWPEILQQAHQSFTTARVVITPPGPVDLRLSPA